MSDWIATPTRLINLDRASMLSVIPSDQEPGRWVIIAQVGPKQVFVSVHDTREEAGEWLIANVLEAPE